MPRPLLSGIFAVLLLVTFFLGDALGMTPAGLGAAVAAAAIGAYLAAKAPTPDASPESVPVGPAASRPAASKPASISRPDPSSPSGETSGSEVAGESQVTVTSRTEDARSAPPSDRTMPSSANTGETVDPRPGFANDPAPPTDDASEGDGQLPTLLPEELAERYYTNFLVPIRQSLPGTRYADLGTVPERIQVLIPAGPDARNALRNAVRAECRSVAVTPDQYMRQFGIYVYSPGKATSGVIVDVPTILHGRASAPSDLSAQELFDRFADRLRALIQEEHAEGMPISIHRNVHSFPLNG